MNRSFFVRARASLLALPVLGLLTLGCSDSGSGGGQSSSGGGDGGAGGFVCSSGTSGSFGNVCIKPPSGGTSSTSSGGGSGGSGGMSGAGGADGMLACPSIADATPLVKAMEPYTAIVTNEATAGPDGTCCYPIFHELCH